MCGGGPPPHIIFLVPLYSIMYPRVFLTECMMHGYTAFCFGALPWRLRARARRRSQARAIALGGCFSLATVIVLIDHPSPHKYVLERA